MVSKRTKAATNRGNNVTAASFWIYRAVVHMTIALLLVRWVVIVRGVKRFEVEGEGEVLLGSQTSTTLLAGTDHVHASGGGMRSC